ncbi:MAG TPA: hypothetical protein VF328_06200 [Mycobacterium sp.]
MRDPDLLCTELSMTGAECTERSWELSIVEVWVTCVLLSMLLVLLGRRHC